MKVGFSLAMATQPFEGHSTIMNLSKINCYLLLIWIQFIFSKRKQDILINTQKTELNIRVRKHSYLKSWLHHLLSLDFDGTAQNEFWYFDTQLKCRIYELKVCQGISNRRRAYNAVKLPGYSKKMMMMMLVSYDIGHDYDDDMIMIGKYKHSQSFMPL